MEGIIAFAGLIGFFSLVVFLVRRAIAPAPAPTLTEADREMVRLFREAAEAGDGSSTI